MLSQSLHALTAAGFLLPLALYLSEVAVCCYGQGHSYHDPDSLPVPEAGAAGPNDSARRWWHAEATEPTVTLTTGFWKQH